jgi:hypothetical protein
VEVAAEGGRFIFIIKELFMKNLKKTIIGLALILVIFFIWTEVMIPEFERVQKELN